MIATPKAAEIRPWDYVASGEEYEPVA